MFFVSLLDRLRCKHRKNFYLCPCYKTELLSNRVFPVLPFCNDHILHFLGYSGHRHPIRSPILHENNRNQRYSDLYISLFGIEWDNPLESSTTIFFPMGSFLCKAVGQILHYFFRVSYLPPALCATPLINAGGKVTASHVLFQFQWSYPAW